MYYKWRTHGHGPSRASGPAGPAAWPLKIIIILNYYNIKLNVTNIHTNIQTYKLTPFHFYIVRISDLSEALGSEAKNE